MHVPHIGDNSASPMMCHYISDGTLSSDIMLDVKINKKITKTKCKQTNKKVQYSTLDYTHLFIIVKSIEPYISFSPQITCSESLVFPIIFLS